MIHPSVVWSEKSAIYTKDSEIAARITSKTFRPKTSGLYRLDGMRKRRKEIKVLRMPTWSFPELGLFGNNVLLGIIFYDNFLLCK